MSNANRIHLLSLAAGTLGHLSQTIGGKAVDDALKAVLADITSLTESSAVKNTSDVGSASVDETNADTAQAQTAQEFCGCGDPTCALIDVMNGTRTDYTVQGILESFNKEFDAKEISTIVLGAVEFVEEQLKNGELVADEAMSERFRVLAIAGIKYKADLIRAGVQSKVTVVGGSEAFAGLLESIFGKGDPRK